MSSFSVRWFLRNASGPASAIICRTLNDVHYYEASHNAWHGTFRQGRERQGDLPLAAWIGQRLKPSVQRGTCKGFGADFDGDEMVVHLPLSAKAQREAARLLPSETLFSLGAKAPDNVLAHFDQDFVLGTWWMGQNMPKGSLQSFLDVLPGDCCRAFTPANGRITLNDGIRLLSHVATCHPQKESAQCIEAWMKKAFEACTVNGVSFGFYELREIAQQISSNVAKLCENPETRSNDALSELAKTALDQILVANCDINNPGVHFAAMALSGARGEKLMKKQIRQLLVARGLLDPGAKSFDPVEGRFFFRQSLVEGMGPDEAFYAGMNARSSLCDKKLGTAYAGGLTRSLVFALWPLVIESEDCGSTETQRNPATCLQKYGFCAACYGTMPNRVLPEIGFPVGLVAAQSIGERGTQLSMQSFQGSESLVNIHSIRRIFGIGTGMKKPQFNFADPSSWSHFVKEMNKIEAYSDLVKNHFCVLWKALHWSPDHRLASVIGNRDPIARLAYRNPAREILGAALKNDSFRFEGPFAKVLFGGFGSTSE